MKRIIKIKEVMFITGLSRSAIYAKIAENVFPKQIKLSERSVGWLEKEVHEWVESIIVLARA